MPLPGLPFVLRAACSDIREDVAFLLGPGMRHRAGDRGSHQLGVLPQGARGVAVLPGLPRLAPLLQVLVAEVDREAALDGVDGDHVAVLEQADRAADLRFGADMADTEAARAAGEAAVGDERHLLAHP